MHKNEPKINPTLIYLDDIMVYELRARTIGTHKSIDSQNPILKSIQYLTTENQLHSNTLFKYNKTKVGFMTYYPLHANPS